MSQYNFTDFYILHKDHPRFEQIQMVEDEPVRVILQKYEMILFTNKGDLLGDPNFGGNLPEYLHETKLSSQYIEGILKAQISDYIPELEDVNYTLRVEFIKDTERYQEVMLIYFKVKDYEVYASVI